MKFLSTVGKETKLGQEEVDRIVGDAISFWDTESPTRSGGTRSVAEIYPLSVSVPNSPTRLGGETGEDTEEELFYVVNFADDEGYSVIAADRRIKDEIAISVGQGNFDEDSDNPGLAVMLSRLDAYAARSIAEHEKWRDSVEVAMLARLANENPAIAEYIAEYLASLEKQSTETRVINEHTLINTSYSYGPWIIDDASRIRPMIPVTWGQGGYDGRSNVFDRSVEATFSTDYLNEVRSHRSGGYIPAGCVAIATVQLMLYWEHSDRIYHQRFIVKDDWNNLRSGHSLGIMYNAPPEIQKLCSDLILWVGQDIGTKYCPSYEGGSTAHSQDAINFLGRSGYRGTSSGRSYSYTPAKSSLDAGRPVYMSGRDGNDDGHSWLMDGYLKQSRTVTVTSTWDPTPGIIKDDDMEISLPYTTIHTYTGTRDLLHNNFGWFGTDNGYYVAGIFDTTGDYTDDLPSWTRSGEPDNYEFDLKMWPNIYK